MKKIGKYVWAFLILLVVVIASGFSTLGSVATTGDSLTYFANKNVVYQMTESKQVKEVYLNVGAIYKEVGQDATVEVEYTNLSAPTASGGSAFVEDFRLSNVYSETGKDGYSYNWLKLERTEAVSAKFLFFRANASLELREIVAVDKSGAVIELIPYSANKDFTVEERLKTLDAQASFDRETVNAPSYYNTFSQEEGMTMVAINSLGAKHYKGLFYPLDGNFGVLSTAFMAAPVAMFGESTFALRFAPFVAAVVALVFAFLLCKELFKSEKYAFFAALLFALGGAILTVGRFGAPYMMVASALLGAAYFMYRFFAKGISTRHSLKDGLNVFLSGAFSVLAIAMETLAIIPVIGVLVLFALGVKRIYAAEKLAAAKAVGDESADTLSEEAKQEKAKAVTAVKTAYDYKKRVAFGLAFFGFIALAFITFLLVGASFYKQLVWAYDDGSAHSMNFIQLVWMNTMDAARVTGGSKFAIASQANVFSWLIPYKASTAISTVSGDKSFTFGVVLNMGISFISLVAMVYVTARVALGFVKKMQDKMELRIRRIYFVLLTMMATAMISAGAKGGATLFAATLFTLASAAFIPLLSMCFENSECGKCKCISDLILYVAAGVGIVFFALCLPVYYGFAVSANYVNVYAWTTFVKDGFFKA